MRWVASLKIYTHHVVVGVLRHTSRALLSGFLNALLPSERPTTRNCVGIRNTSRPFSAKSIINSNQPPSQKKTIIDYMMPLRIVYRLPLTWKVNNVFNSYELRQVHHPPLYETYWAISVICQPCCELSPSYRAICMHHCTNLQ